MEQNRPTASSAPTAPEQKPFAVSAPTVSLPKGGGAIRGMGEKFAANPVTGTGAMTVPIFTSPGRSGFGPQLSLSYDSGAGNGVFGLGWGLSLPDVVRKTDKGLPLYEDGRDSDEFILSGAEDLVPVLWREPDGLRPEAAVRVVNGHRYEVRRFRPRVEGTFARIERWTEVGTGETHWRSISRDNITTLYGLGDESRIADPCDSSRVFRWLICRSYDDKGNLIVYEYKAEDSTGIEHGHAHERNRTENGRAVNRYLKRVLYGNRVPYFPSHVAESDPTALPTAWMFEVVFDYSEHDPDAPTPDGQPAAWSIRPDPFSAYRSGFEVRTYRRCRRILMFHHFPEDADVGRDCLVRSTDLTFSDERAPQQRIEPSDPPAEELPDTGFSLLRSISQSGYCRTQRGYVRRRLPPLEFTYNEARPQGEVRELDDISQENLPVGLDGSGYQWADLDGEGLNGILTEAAGAWFYKRNLSANNLVVVRDVPRTEARFGATELLAERPSLPLAGGQAQLLDLAGDGQLDLVTLGAPVAGFFERTADGGWESFTALASVPVLNWGDPNLKFVDLTGDGHADVLVTEDQVFSWYQSRGEEGFGPASKVPQAMNEEEGPRLVFADGTQSIHLADMSGDGLADLVRVRNGEICYWPNLGYGRFGAKVAMDQSPWLDHPDQFDPRRVRLADLDGSGPTDLVYLAGDGVHLYFNRSGNGWTAPWKLGAFPRTDRLSSISIVDLLGNGTSCLVWSSPLPNDAGRALRYVQLIGETKPHLLVRANNNLGAETLITYAPSTKFYLQDRQDGRPWITRLPFPVHCVEKVTVTDKWRGTSFATSYSYHHGYFDGQEREFRGFGRVEQVDVEAYGTFSDGNVHSPYITNDQTLYQPPVKTITWFHTGAFLDRERILAQFADEYFPRWFEAQQPDRENVLGAFKEHVLPEPDLGAEDLDVDDWREALRACKGMVLRQEIYELDVDELQRGRHRPVKLFSTAYHNCKIQRLQERGTNQHAVFLVTESEAITYHYDLALAGDVLRPDPRVAHTLNLNIDELGNVLQSVAVAHPRLERFQDDALAPDEIALIQRVQGETHLAYRENRFTTDIDADDVLRLRMPCEVLTYELTGISPRRAGGPFTLDDLRRYRLSPNQPEPGEIDVPELAYHQLASSGTAEKRLVEHVRTLYFASNLVDPLPLGQHGPLGLPFESYKLALTGELARLVLRDRFTADVEDVLADAAVSGYLSGLALAERFPGLDISGQYWIRSGVVGFGSDDPEHDAPEHFYLPERYADPFGQETLLEYDPLDLFIASSRDPKDNLTRVGRFDYRVLAPCEVIDLNDNASEVIFDAIGLPAAMAVKGKGLGGSEGDRLTGFADETLVHPRLDEVIRFFEASDYAEAEAEAARWLDLATARHLYDLGDIVRDDGSIAWGQRPAGACTLLRETHASAGPSTLLQAAFEYSDGTGNVLVKKMQAEPETPGGPLRWIASGRTVLNNKGKPVKQYEPYFSAVQHRFEIPEAVGVTPVLYYDAAGRTIRVEAPDGSYSRVSFSPWEATAFDANDTVGEAHNAWFARNAGGTAEQRRAAQVAADHADTPARTVLDSLGREVVSIAHNRAPDEGGLLRDARYVTFTRLDAEGKPLWIRDARQNLVMQYVVPPLPNHMPTDPTEGYVPAYDVAGNLLFQHSMDAGDRWMLSDAAGQPLFIWDVNERYEAGLAVREERRFRSRYDELHRPLTQTLEINGGDPQVLERFVYGEDQTDDRLHNLRGQPHRHYDSSGLVTNVGFDFKGNLLTVTRRLAWNYSAAVLHWPEEDPDQGLEREVFTKRTEYDALNRMTRLYNWHSDPARVAVYEPHYSRRGLLESEDIVMRARWVEGGGYEGGTRTTAIVGLEHNAKGQRTCLRQGNGTTTRYDYDPTTFRLAQLRTTGRHYDPPFPRDVTELNRQSVLQLLRYTYDPSGNITEIYDDAYEPVFFRNEIVEPNSRYTYDALYRLTEASGREDARWNDTPIGQFGREADEVTFPLTERTLRNYRQRYFYDQVGNILQMRHISDSERWRRSYDYAEDSNRLLRTWIGSAEDQAVRYEYDLHGSMLNLANVAGEQWMRWDYKDMIQGLDRKGGGLAWYNYDASKQRTRKRLELLGGRVEERFYLGGMEVFREYDVQGDVVEKIESHHLFVDDQRALLIDDVLPTGARASDDTLFRYQYGNHIGSAVLELDEHATPISYEEFHPYGTTAYEARGSGVRATAKRYRYTGMERDDESGAGYHTARYYAPWLGRWISTDPVLGTCDHSCYSYCLDQPTNLTDRNGRDPSDDEPAGRRAAVMGPARRGLWARVTRGARPIAIAAILDLNAQGHGLQPPSHVPIGSDPAAEEEVRLEEARQRYGGARARGEVQPESGGPGPSPPPPNGAPLQLSTGEIARVGDVLDVPVPPDIELWSTAPGQVQMRIGSSGASELRLSAAGEVQMVLSPTSPGAPRGTIAAQVGDTLTVDLAGRVSGVPPIPPPGSAQPSGGSSSGVGEIPTASAPPASSQPGGSSGSGTSQTPTASPPAAAPGLLTRIAGVLGVATNVVGAVGMLHQAIQLGRFWRGDSSFFSVAPGTTYFSDPSSLPEGTRVSDSMRERMGTVRVTTDGRHHVLWDDNTT
jgi:RHS repeat-associated protein